MIKFNPDFEQINITNYSPRCFINEISEEYKHNPFLMPIITIEGNIIPIHPDTLNDLNIDKKYIIDYYKVYPTSSFRTVYEENSNIFYKLPVLRKITRSIRNLSDKELERSVKGNELLLNNPYPKFNFLPEITYKNNNENFNYIIRKIPNVKLYPWFYCIASKKFSNEFMIECMKNMITIWLYYASIGIYFDSFHTQNILVDNNCNIYYRDLSDIRNLEIDVLKPSFIDKLQGTDELLSIFFDRSVCEQNIKFVFEYYNLSEYKDEIITYILNEIDKFQLKFPDYSLGFDKNKDGHIPIRLKLTDWRKIKGDI